MSSRRGFTLVELLIACLLLVMVGGVMYNLLITVQRVSGRQTSLSNMQGNLRGGMQLIESELQELATYSGAATTDINSMSASLIDYNAMRGLGETCGVTPTTVQIRQSSYTGVRDPVASAEQLLLYVDHDSTQTTDDTWVPLAITAVGNGTCSTGAATASWDLTVALPLTAAQIADSIPVPGLVRTLERMEIGKVTDSGNDWLGIRSVTAGELTLVPVVGPLTTNGLAFTYYDGAGTATGVPSAVKTIVVKLRGISADLVHTGMGSGVGNPTDSLVIR
ncbi:MAG TPA: prepilin-type N-terminal cleavage/methylation domain-containing protein, partial [Gemmatimonadales bacterium]|nr:prepilin-type N-terminal cleavage/methylation domain-containing protein [Gemmatimonadales bacterium]